MLPAAPLLIALAGCGGRFDRQPSVLIVSMDTVRWDHTSLSGYPRDTTPNLARLAATPGARTFDRAYSGASWSLPAYATLFTGREALSHGVGFLRGALDRSQPTLPQVLSAYGYRTGAFTSGPHLDRTTGLAQGFDTYEHAASMASLGRAVDQALAWVRDGDERPFFAFVQGYDAHPPQVLPAAYAEVFDHSYEGRVHDVTGVASPRLASRSPNRTGSFLNLVASVERLRSREDELAEGALLFDHSLEWVRVRGGPRRAVPAVARPGLATLITRHGYEGPPPVDLPVGEDLDGLALADAIVDGALDPALPARVLGDEFGVSERDLDHYGAHYDAGVLTADYHLGRLLHGLEAQGVLDHTVVVALADHGESLGETGQIAHDTEYGDTVFHVPLVVWLPDDATPRHWDGVVSLADLLPTLSDLLGLTPPSSMTGESFAAVLGAAPPAVDPERAVLEASMCCYAVRTAAWELRAARDPAPIEGGVPGFGRPQTAEEDAWGPWRWELLADGVGPDVAEDHPDVVAALAPRLDDWFRKPVRKRRRNVSHGDVEGRPDLVDALREGGYWKPGEKAP